MPTHSDTPSIIQDNMKLKFCILLVFCFILINKMFAQGYGISQDRKEITISGNCTIPIEEFAPNNVNIYGNREKGGVGSNKGVAVDLFSQRTLDLNKNIKGFSFQRNENGIATIIIDFDKINNETTLHFYQAIFTDKKDSRGQIVGKEWNPDYRHTFAVRMVKSNSVSEESAIKSDSDGYSSDNKNVQNTSGIEEVNLRIENLIHEVDRIKNKSVFDISIPLLIALFVGLLIGFFINKRNRVVLKHLSEECSDLRKVVDNWKVNNNNQMNSHYTSLQKNKEKFSMTDEDIKRLIVEQIKSFQASISPSTQHPIIATNPIMDPVKKDNDKDVPTIDTDNIKYHPDDNSFSLEQTDIKIFKIYSKKGEYFYTIVDDSAVREEIIGMLQMFESCITYQTTDGVARRVEPVTDGKLRKEDNKFYVDANNKLVVKFA